MNFNHFIVIVLLLLFVGWGVFYSDHFVNYFEEFTQSSSKTIKPLKKK